MPLPRWSDSARTSKFAVTQLVDKADRRTAWKFLEHLLRTVPYRIHTILTDNGIQFAEQPAAIATPPGRARCAST